MSEQVEAKKVHPFSKEARAEKAKAEKEAQVEEVNEPTFEELYNIPEVDTNKTYTFEFAVKRDNPNQFISNHCEIFDEVEKRIRVIRYAPHEVSVFQDEQKELPSGGYYEDQINFRYSECIVDGKKANLVKFLLLHNDNESNGRLPSRQLKFKLVDKEADAKRALEVNSVRTKAVNMASDCKDEEMLPFAKILGINIKRTPSEIRQEFVVKASQKPIEFIKGLGDPKNKRLYVVLKAFEQGIIEDSYIKNTINWRGSKVEICQIPAGAISSDYITDWSFNSQEGEDFYKQLLKQVI